MTLANGAHVPLDIARLTLIVDEACAGLDGVDAGADPRRDAAQPVRRRAEDELALASILAARTLIEKDPDYTYVTARLLLDTLRREVLSSSGAPTSASQADMATRYADYFPPFIKTGIEAELLDPSWRAST